MWLLRRFRLFHELRRRRACEFNYQTILMLNEMEATPGMMLWARKEYTEARVRAYVLRNKSLGVCSLNQRTR